MKKISWMTGGLTVLLATLSVPAAAQQGIGNHSSQKQVEAITTQREQARTRASRERVEQERQKMKTAAKAAGEKSASPAEPAAKPAPY